MSSGLTNPTAWPICYGDEVFLQLFESALGDGMLRRRATFVYGDGRLDKRVLVEVMAAGCETPSNNRDACFKITPKLNYRAAGALAEANPGDDLVSLEQQASLEQSLNQRQVAKLHGEVVSYGSVVQLQHTLSGRFVSQMKARAEHKQDALRLHLHDGDDTSGWELNPGYKANKAGEAAKYGIAIVFRNSKDRDYAIASFPHTEGPGVEPISRVGPYLGEAEQLTGYRTGALFTLSRYRSARTPSRIQQRVLVSGNSIVTLFHAEEQGYLSCDEGGRLFFLKARSARGSDATFHPRSSLTSLQRDC